jgi:RNA polymerase sigma-70 factor (ECF subfamily)
MDDKELVAMLFDRSKEAVDVISKQYGSLCEKVVCSVLGDDEDAKECVNDVWLAVWNSIPPNNPDCLPAYINKIARRIAISRYRYNTRKKRDSGYTVAFSELEECIPDNSQRADNDNEARVKSILSDFVRSLDGETRVLFVRRYLYLESVQELAKRYDLKENNISVKLHRARKKLRKLLEKEAIYV